MNFNGLFAFKLQIIRVLLSCDLAVLKVGFFDKSD